MRKRIFAILTAASMFVSAAPAYVRAGETPENAKGSIETGVSNMSARALVGRRLINGITVTGGNGQATDRQLDSISRVDDDNDTARDLHANTAPGWQQGGTAPTTTTVPIRPVPVTTVP